MSHDDPYFPFIPETVSALTLGEVAAALEAGIRAGAAGNLSHHGDLFLASLCSRVLAERLERAGLAVIRTGRPNSGSPM